MPLTSSELRFSYDAETDVLDGVTLAVEPGRVLGIAGAAGAGKSTLLRCLAGLEHGYRGSVAEDSLGECSSCGSRRWHGRVGYVAQSPERQLFARTVFDDVAFGPNNLGLTDQEVLLRVRGALEAVGFDFERSLEESPLCCSGGEQRAIALAGVLALETPYLLLDEPTAGLDSEHVEKLARTLRGLRSKGVGVAVVSHDMDALARMSDVVAVMSRGRITCMGTPYELFGRAGELRDAGLEAPGIYQVAYALERSGRAEGLGSVPYEELPDAILATACRQAGTQPRGLDASAGARGEGARDE